ncbi:MAG: caspase family protein [Bacteroidota bacterium]
MSKGISLHIGVNYLSQHSTDYEGRTLPNLNTCENDAMQMEEIARQEGFEECHSLFTKDATYHNFQQKFIEIVGKLNPGDLFLLTFSGHGLGVLDHDGDEDDGQDEAWCLYDRFLIDDLISKHLSQIRQGVRVVVVSDSCHSGTMLKFFDGDTRWKRPTKKHPFPNENHILASVILLAACRDMAKARIQKDSKLSNFTRDLLATWNGGKYQGNYKQFLMVDMMDSSPDPFFIPNYYEAGQNLEIFRTQNPFRINS